MMESWELEAVYLSRVQKNLQLYLSIDGSHLAMLVQYIIWIQFEDTVQKYLLSSVFFLLSKLKQKIIRNIEQLRASPLFQVSIWVSTGQIRDYEVSSSFIDHLSCIGLCAKYLKYVISFAHTLTPLTHLTNDLATQRQ